MRIAYLGQCDTSRENGVLKKVCRFMDFAAGRGHQPAFFALSTHPGCWQALERYPHSARHYRNKMELLTQNRRQLQEVVSWKPDLIYLRFNKYLPGMETLLKTFPTVVEVNSDDVREYRATTSLPVYVYHCLTRARLLANARAHVFLTQENARKYARFHKPCLVMGDSIELERFPLPARTHNPAPRIVFLANNMAARHGIDKIVDLAAEFSTWDFDIVGLYRKEVQTGDLENLHFHGHLPDAQYGKIVAAADAALATLALHRIGMHETTPLKVREYLAYGVPVITGYRDPDFPANAPYILQLPNREDNVMTHLKEIENFVRSWRGKRVARADIAHLDVSVKENQRFDFLESLMAREAVA